jgi:membrane protein involved in colicin uptake
MKCILALLALTLVPVAVGAQQQQQSDPDGCANVGFKSPTSEVIRCLQLQRQKEKETEAKLAEAQKVAEELLKAADDARKRRSANKNEQIDGEVDVVKDLNSKGNSNEASKAVTDQSLTVLDKLEHRKNEIMDNVGKTVANGVGPQASSPPVYAGGSHQLNASTTNTQAQQPQTLEERLQFEANEISTSPTLRKVVVAGDRAEQVAEQAAERAYQENERKEKIEQAKALAEANRIAQKAKDEKAAAQKAEDDREDAIEARKEARKKAEARAAWLAAHGVPPSPPVWSTGVYVPDSTSTSTSTSDSSASSTSHTSTDGVHGGPK